jgi:hypothetical protein
LACRDLSVTLGTAGAQTQAGDWISGVVGMPPVTGRRRSPRHRKESEMLTLDRTEETLVRPTTKPADSSGYLLTARHHSPTLSLLLPTAPTAASVAPAFDQAIQRWMPLVVPALGVLISASILIIWSIL